MSETIKIDKQDYLAVLTLDNPPGNTWTPDNLARLIEIVATLNKDNSNRALIVQGAGDKFFSAGADLKHFNHLDKGKSFEFSNLFGEAFSALAQYKGVSIAAINGYAMGGGLEAALACDIRIADETANMGLPECSVGLLPAGLGTQHLPWLVGEQWAKRMILLGEIISASKALEIGLISELVAKGAASTRAVELARKLEKQSPTAVLYCKQLIMKARSVPLNSVFPLERELFVKLWESPNQKEGVSAFLEKRKPDWDTS